MSDLVERLRRAYGIGICSQIRRDAADEIERLRAASAEDQQLLFHYENAAINQRASIIEECAKVADNFWKDHGPKSKRAATHKEIAAAIRALKT